MGGSSSLLLGSSIALHSRLELLTWSESDHPACLDRNLFSGLGIATGSLLLVPQIKITKPGNLYLLVGLERQPYLFKELLNQFLGFPLVQAEFFVQPLSHLCLGKCPACHRLVP